MGLDELLLESERERPTLRLYTWAPDTLSLGYFQRFSEVPGASLAGAVVRRITGGGAIHHVNELTFSITAPLDHPLYRGPVGESYARVHDAIAEALVGLGVEALRRGDRTLESDRAGTGMCFHESTPLDLAWSRRKGVGSAQRRRAGRVLHHGSIKLGSSPLEGDVAVVGGREVSPQEVGERLASAFARRFGLVFEDEGATDGELAAATDRGRRYSDPTFVRRR